MEYIEPKPAEPAPHRKRNKIIAISVASALLAILIALTYYFTITRIFVEYDNIELFTYSYRYDVEDGGVTIDAIKDDAILPKKFRIPNKLGGHKVVEISDNVFSYNEDIEEIIFPDSLERIGNQCFEGCTNLKTFNIPTSLESIGTDAFNGTSWLEEHDDGEVTIGKFLYTYKGKMDYPAAVVASEESVDLSKYQTVVDLSKYSSMSKGVFKDQSGLVYVEFGNQFNTIYESTFENCSSLETVVLPSSITSIDASAFAYCASLVNINIPNSVTSIGEYAFTRTSITGDLVLPSTLSTLGSHAFEGCTKISSVTIPETLSVINDYLFNGATSLKTINLPAKEYTTNSIISSIGNAAFKNTAISEFTLPFNSSLIGQEAFSNCPNLTSLFVYNNTIGNLENTSSSSKDYQGLKSIKTKAFYNSPLFKEIVLVDKDNNKGERNSVNIPVTLKELGSPNETSNLFTSTAIETLNLVQDVSIVSDDTYKNYLLEVDSSSKQSTNRLKTLSSTVCEDCLYLKKVNFGGDLSTISIINSAAFKGCTSLKDIAIPNSVTTIDTNIFEGCTNLVSASLPNACASLPKAAFKNCSSLKTIYIPKSYITINDEVFSGCTSLTSVTFEENSTVRFITNSAFENCSSLTSIVIPSSCTSLGTSVFKGTTSLNSVTLPNDSQIKEITTSMFEGSSIEEISLPASCIKISSNAFKDSSLKTLIINNSEIVIELDNSAFEGTNIESIKVNKNLLDLYKQSTSWSQYGDKISEIL